MRDNFQACLDQILKSEGGWSDDPRDPGGPTMKGITLKTFEDFKDCMMTKESLKSISDRDVHDIYKLNYWDAVDADEIVEGADLLVFDAAVNCGVNRAKVMAKDVTGSNSYSVEAINDMGAEKFIEAYSQRREEYYKSLKNFAIYGKGWLKRVEITKQLATDMA